VHELEVEEWLVLAVIFMYTGGKTVVRTLCGNSNDFKVKVGMHRGSALTHTHTQPFYCWSGICPGPPGSAGTRKVKPSRLKPIWIYWSKR